MRVIIQSISMALIMLIVLFAAGCTDQKKSETKEIKVKEIDLSQYKDSKPEQTMRLLFIHHSCGGQWLADKGDDIAIYPDSCIYKSHPNGGGLRALLEQNNYEVHEAAYKSAIGDKTDVCDWNAKFRDKMDQILKIDQQDNPYKNASVKNDIVMFKSCYPANAIDPDGAGKGNPDSTEKTMANYKAAYNNLLEYFKTQPNTLFVCVTAPPLVEAIPNHLKEMIKKLIAQEKTVKSTGKRARQFNNWLKDTENGWLASYQGRNVVVFDYYDVLTDHGKSNFARFPTKGGKDSHPNFEGNSLAAKEFIPFLNRSVKRFSSGN